jgi:hypothetical protein
MAALRQRLIDDLHLRGYAERTVEAYVVSETVVRASKQIGKSRAPLAHERKVVRLTLEVELRADQIKASGASNHRPLVGSNAC